MRKTYLDNIRWATVLLVLFYHVFYLYNHAGVLGNVGSPGTTSFQDSVLYFVYPWFMALLFLIAGISSRYSLEKRTDKGFLRSRVLKLLVPSTLGLFIYHWIGGYLNVKCGGGLDTIPAAFRYPIFVLSGTGPLWFIQLLFLFSVLLVLIRKIKASEKLWEVCGKCNIIVLILLAIPIWGAAQILNAPIITTYRFGIYFFLYLLGYFVFSHDEVQDRVEKIHIPALIVAIGAGIGYVIYYFGQNYADSACLKSIFTNLYLWAVILAILGCGKAWCNRTSKFSDYMTKASFGLYIVHYPVVLWACYLLFTYTKLPAFMMYILALLLEFVCTPLVYELLRRIPVIRYLVLGIKTPKKEKQS